MSHAGLTIKTPRGVVFTGSNGSAELKWNQGFGPTWTGKFTRAQMFVDSEVLRLSSPYVPLRTGTLQHSGQLGTQLGQGEVNWIAPYASRQYYSTADSRSYDPMRGGHWFERMKADHGKSILAGAKKLAGGK